jgi:deazaflavin-dependent oxidoreductase (nitroreductase family)
MHYAGSRLPTIFAPVAKMTYQPDISTLARIRYCNPCGCPVLPYPCLEHQHFTQENHQLPNDTRTWLNQSANTPYAYLTTTGRRTGKPHRIEIWFAIDNGKLLLLAGGRERADWIRNIQANAAITVEIGTETHPGIARIVAPGTIEDRRARELLVAKYSKGDNLDEWGRTSLPVMIIFQDDDSTAP